MQNMIMSKWIYRNVYKSCKYRNYVSSSSEVKKIIYEEVWDNNDYEVYYENGEKEVLYLEGIPWQNNLIKEEGIYIFLKPLLIF